MGMVFCITSTGPTGTHHRRLMGVEDGACHCVQALKCEENAVQRLRDCSGSPDKLSESEHSVVAALLPHVLKLKGDHAKIRPESLSALKKAYPVIFGNL